MGDRTAKRRRRVWLFDLDNTLHDASHAAFGWTNQAMNEYIIAHLGMPHDEASRLRQRYLKDYGATLLGLVRHHGVDAAHFLEQTHVHPELERLARTSTHDRAALKKLAGRRYVLTNAPRAYALRVLRILKLDRCIHGVVSIEDMTMFGQLRPKPDARMFRHVAARLGVRPADCVLVEDTLEHQKAARGVGMTTAWMQRYLEGRFGGSIRDAFNARANHGFKRQEVGVHRCRRPAYVCAKIKSLQKLRTLS
ncbi:MAG TPA: pyrimidine 5'-nucleotidase [Burkholderiaceae bacterium]